MTSQPEQLLSVLIPAFNEEATIERLLHQVLRLGSMLREVILVDDGSDDGTADIARRMARRHPILRVCRFDENQGKTAAIQRAVQMARGELIVIQDADLEYDPGELPRVIEPILQGRADVVFGSRFLTRRGGPRGYFRHYVANKLLTVVSNLLTGRNLSDVETCYKCFRAGVIKPLVLSSKGFGMEVEITALVCRTKARTVEVPISYVGRTFDQGKKIGPRDGLAALWYMLYYNLVAPIRSSGRRYIEAVNGYLAERPTFVPQRSAGSSSDEATDGRPPGEGSNEGQPGEGSNEGPDGEFSLTWERTGQRSLSGRPTDAPPTVR